MICQLFLVVSSRLTSKVSIEQMNMRINNPVMKHYTIKNFFLHQVGAKLEQLIILLGVRDKLRW